MSDGVLFEHRDATDPESTAWSDCECGWSGGLAEHPSHLANEIASVLEVVLSGHRHPGEIDGWAGEWWLTCSCGERLEVETHDGQADASRINALYFQHVASAQAIALRDGLSDE